MRRFMAVVAVVAALTLLGVLTAYRTMGDGVPGGGQPSPSACVERALASMEEHGEPLPDEPPADPGERLLYDRLTYRISGEDFMRFAVYRYVEPERVPEQYRFPVQPELTGTDPLTGIFLGAMWANDCLPPNVLGDLLAELDLVG